MQVTASMLREVFQRAQREILEIETPERYQARWERMAALLNEKIASKAEEYTDEQTGVRLTVNQHNPEFPGHPKLTIICPVQHILSLEEINEAMDRLQSKAGISPQHRMSPLNLVSDHLWNVLTT